MDNKEIEEIREKSEYVSKDILSRIRLYEEEPELLSEIFNIIFTGTKELKDKVKKLEEEKSILKDGIRNAHNRITKMILCPKDIEHHLNDLGELLNK